MAAKKRARGNKRKDRNKPGRRKRCWFTDQGIIAIDYKDVDLLRRYMSERGCFPTSANTIARRSAWMSF